MEKRTINNDDETFLTRSNDSKTIREHLKKKKLKYLDIKEIKGIEEGLVATKTKLKEKLKTVLDSPKNRNSVKWNIQNMKL